MDHTVSMKLVIERLFVFRTAGRIWGITRVKTDPAVNEAFHMVIKWQPS